MTDIVDPVTRSRMMAAIRGKDTKPEMVVRRYLHSAGLRYVLHDCTLPGKPDLVFPGRRLAVFVHGCFWHRHPGCRYATTPATRREFWEKKFAANVGRDRRTADALEAAGWTVITVWECETRSSQFLERLAQAVRHVPVAGRTRPKQPAARQPRRRQYSPPSSASNPGKARISLEAASGPTSGK
ncbi:very short patch repair endonuclease [uncultured Azohydromonas sp.]|uniref:very short patch repair endonuclease n=1 Tax=uncultured Azohydromonas sp. TaxID=487342 RepID=UPI002602CD82|nr:very short patch repair endonuclease [uncultured Azohydromonas sp.]